MRIGFDNEKYLKMQSEHIRNRIGKFGNKLYLEFGGFFNSSCMLKLLFSINFIILPIYKKTRKTYLL